MMYKKNFTSAIKLNGKVLREQGDTVALPFGSEYSILLKNLNSVKAQVKVSVDGIDATEGTWLVLQPNSSLDLERFIKNSNFNTGNRFKFIERTSAIEDHRGIGSDDGLIRIEYKFEKVYPPIQVLNCWNGYVPTNGYGISNDVFLGGSQITYNTSGDWTKSAHNINSTPTASIYSMSASIGKSEPSLMKCAAQISILRSCSLDTAETSMPRNDAGITVPGSKSDQKFYSTYDFTCEQSEVMVLRLKGEVGNKVVRTPITVEQKPICSSCGTVNKAVNKFCRDCGTALVIY